MLVDLIQSARVVVLEHKGHVNLQQLVYADGALVVTFLINGCCHVLALICVLGEPNSAVHHQHMLVFPTVQVERAPGRRPRLQSLIGVRRQAANGVPNRVLLLATDNEASPTLRQPSTLLAPGAASGEIGIAEYLRVHLQFGLTSDVGQSARRQQFILFELVGSLSVDVQGVVC